MWLLDVLLVLVGIALILTKMADMTSTWPIRDPSEERNPLVRPLMRRFGIHRTLGWLTFFCCIVIVGFVVGAIWCPVVPVKIACIVGGLVVAIAQAAIARGNFRQYSAMCCAPPPHLARPRRLTAPPPVARVAVAARLQPNIAPSRSLPPTPTAAPGSPAVLSSPFPVGSLARPVVTAESPAPVTVRSTGPGTAALPRRSGRVRGVVPYSAADALRAAIRSASPGAEETA